MKVPSDKSLHEYCMNTERRVQALIKIIDVFCNPNRISNWNGTLRKDRKRFAAFQTYLGIYAYLKDSKGLPEHCLLLLL